MMLVGVLVASPLALATGPLPPVTLSLTPWYAGASIGGVLGYLLAYRGLRLGKVGVVAALTSTEGVIAALLAIVAGERLTFPVAIVLVVLAGGVALVAVASSESETHEHGPEQARNERLAALYGALAALVFGVSIFSMAQLGKSLSPFAAVIPVRILGTVAVFIPLALSGRLRITRRAAPMVAAIGVLEVLGNAVYVAGTSASIAIAAVLASQFAGIAAIGAFFVYHERLTLRQRSGVVAIAAGVAALTLLR
jgi:drug/metabolite transporter (DMT)-like permease